MATRDDLYRKFGITAEAAQLFETELSTLLLAARGLEKGWHVQPDADEAGKAAAEIDGHTLGMLLSRLRDVVKFDDSLKDKLASAVGARNRLMHGFYERHNFKIDTDARRLR